MAQIKGGEEGGRDGVGQRGDLYQLYRFFCFFLGRGGCVLRKLGDQL